jgi:acetyl-CoA C-acetyltransferase
VRQTVIVSAARTPFGAYGGALKDIPAVELGAMVIKEVVRRAAIAPELVDYVLMGIVVEAGTGQIPSRQATLRAGLPVQVASDTIDKVCASSLRAVNLGDALIRVGDVSTVIAGGMENMSQGPYLVEKARWGYRLGDGKLVDATIRDGLWCSIRDVHMGIHGQDVAAEYGVTREEMDRWALRSQTRASAAIRDGKFKDEIVPVEIPQRKGPPLVIDTDESPRADTTYEKLAALRPAFTKDGAITAGNAPGINDGAGALLLMSADKAKELGKKPLATIISYGTASDDPPYLARVPHLAAEAALRKAGLAVKDLDLIEANEAFAAVAVTAMALGRWPEEKVNVNGGAVALGHPIGASGARILMTLIYELRRRGGGLGLATICSGAGQGEATIVRVEP